MSPIARWKIIAAVGTAVVILLVAGYLIAQRLSPPAAQIAIALDQAFVFPDLTGRFQVGKTSIYLVDPGRPAFPGSGDPRESVLTVFYPAQPAAGAAPGPYADSALRTAYAREVLTADSASALDRIHAHAFTDAPVDRSVVSYPILLFSPGGGEQPLFYTSLLEEISSHGFVVVAVPEPFDTPVVPLPDGRVLTVAQMNAWCQQDPSCQMALRGDTAAVQALADAMKNNRAQDLVFTLNELARINQDHPILQDALELGQIGVFGHSFGGATAVRLAQLDPRVDAVAVLDSDIFLVIAPDSAPLSVPVLHLTSADIDATADELTEIERLRQRATAYLQQGSVYSSLQIAGTTHQSFQTDALLLQDAISIGGEPVLLHAIEVSAADILGIISSRTIGFFHAYLK